MNNSLIGGTGTNGPSAAGQKRVNKGAVVSASAYRVFSSLVPEQQEMVDNMLGMAGLLMLSGGAFVFDPRLA
jgi:hypothetical protein